MSASKVSYKKTKDAYTVLLKLSAQKDATIDYLKERLAAMNVDDKGTLTSKFEVYSDIFSNDDLLKLSAVPPSRRHDHSFVMQILEILYRNSKSAPSLSQRHGLELMPPKDRCTVKEMFRIRAKHFATDDLDYLARSQETTIQRTLSNALSNLRQKKNKESISEE